MTVFASGPRESETARPSFEAFAAGVAERLKRGQETYGDRSFGRPPRELASEIEEEILDICAWSFILWARLRDLRREIEERTR
ncbi:MAG: hypothetical protein ACREQY_08445 [Candidatus Binatia bacterium]